MSARSGFRARWPVVVVATLVGCAPTAKRYVAVAQDHARPEPKVAGDSTPIPVAVCRATCGFAVKPDEEIVACEQVFVSSKLDDRLHYPIQTMTVCKVR
jgi:hypothetical protein